MNLPFDNESLLTEHLKIIRRMTWQLSTQTGYDMEDLFSEACLQYLLLRVQFDPGKGIKFSTFIWKAVRNMLLNYIAKESKTVLIIEDDDPPDRIKRPLQERFISECY